MKEQEGEGGGLWDEESQARRGVACSRFDNLARRPPVQ